VQVFQAAGLAAGAPVGVTVPVPVETEAAGATDRGPRNHKVETPSLRSAKLVAGVGGGCLLVVAMAILFIGPRRAVDDDSPAA
jgi:hypothetical protein